MFDAVKRIWALGKCAIERNYSLFTIMNPIDDWLKTGWARDSQTRTQLLDSLFYISCSLKNNAFSVLHYVIKVTLHSYMLHLFEIHSALELSRKALLGCRFAASRLREAFLLIGNNSTASFDKCFSELYFILMNCFPKCLFSVYLILFLFRSLSVYVK